MKLQSLLTYFAACLSSLVLVGVKPTPKTYHVYFLGGQSNMDGLGHVSDLPDALQQPVPDTVIFHGNSSPDNTAIDGNGIWTRLRPGHGAGFTSNGVANQYSGNFGPELTFAARLKEQKPTANIALIKYSRGGTSLDCGAAQEFGCWDPDFRGENGVNQYDHFLATLRHAFATSDIDGDGVEDKLVPAGIVWMQGESDASFTQAIALGYEENLKRLMDLMRAALQVDDLPVVIGRISDSGQDDDGIVWTHGDLIREAQAAFVKQDARAALVTATDAYGYSDLFHYDSAGYLDLGWQFAEAMLTLEQP